MLQQEKTQYFFRKIVILKQIFQKISRSVFILLYYE